MVFGTKTTYCVIEAGIWVVLVTVFWQGSGLGVWISFWVGFRVGVGTRVRLYALNESQFNVLTKITLSCLPVGGVNILHPTP